MAHLFREYVSMPSILRLATLLLILGVLLLAGLYFSSLSEQDPSVIEQVSAIEQMHSFQELSSYLQTLAISEGGVQAFRVLRDARIPPNIDVHLLAHVVGDQLYAQEGVDGIINCTRDFRNACSHSIVIGALLEFGEGAIPDIQEACYQAPGGKGAYTMCFHGLGHGVLAFLDYEYEDAVSFCKRFGTAEYRDREYIECVGGATMEMVSSVHDRALWEEKRSKYTRLDDPLYPCTAEYVEGSARDLCITYIWPQLLLATGADLGKPNPDDFARAFRVCDEISNSREQEVCWGSFGKEFVVLANDRDVRSVEEMSNEQLSQIYKWCTLAENERGISACTISAVQSLYWGGENDRTAAVTFCNQIPDQSTQDTCTNELITAVSFYIDDREYYTAFCNELSPQYRGVCKTRTGIL